MIVKKWNAIAIMSKNGVIGEKNFIPFESSLDRLWFKMQTYKKIIVFGRKTFESIKMLSKNSSYLILTKQKNCKAFQKNVEIINDINQIPDSPDIWIAGGESVYKKILAKCKFLFLTVLKINCSGDKYFPSFKRNFILQKKILDTKKICIYKYENIKSLESYT